MLNRNGLPVALPLNRQRKRKNQAPKRQTLKRKRRPLKWKQTKPKLPQKAQQKKRATKLPLQRLKIFHKM